MKDEFKKIFANDMFSNESKLAELFYDNAKLVVQEIKYNDFPKNIETTQFRQFYDKVLELNDKAKKADFDTEIKPMLYLLISKAEYSKTRKLSGDNFVYLIENSIKNTNNKEQLQNFKYFLEAIIGFMPKKG